ncbi:MAG TPA: hypothetical protein VGH80_10885 [Xanthomonadaceae bacterium]|jgi:hypothetical protein
MTRKTTRDIVKQSLPSAKIVTQRKPSDEHALSVDAATPSADVLASKYGATGLVRSGVKQAVRSSAAGHAEDIEVCEVLVEKAEGKGVGKAVRRTLIVDRKKGRIIGSSG